MSKEKLRVLLLDDQEDLRVNLARYLQESCGYQVDTASSGPEALALIENTQERYDVALLDQVIENGMDGIQVMQEIKKCYPDMECIIFTGWGLDTAMQVLRAGAYRYLAKPIQTEELRVLIQMAAEHRWLKQELETTRREKEWLETFLEIGRATTSVLELDQVLEEVHRQVGRLTDVSGLCVILYDEKSQMLDFELAFDQGKKQAKWQRPFNALGGLTDWVIRNRLPLLLGDYPRDLPAFPHGEQPGDTGTQLGIKSWLGIPLLIQDKVIGAITVQSYELHRFSETDQQILTAVASQVAIAIENARAYMSEQEAKTYLDRLISSSLDGIIAIDERGLVKIFSEGAERIMGYSRQEVLDQQMRVDKLYGSIETAREIKRRLVQQDRLPDYEITVRAKDGQAIPVLLSATVLSDSTRKVIGSVGFFKDLRALRKAEAELRLVLDTINTVNSAHNLSEGLNALAERMVHGLNVTFCHILLLDSDTHALHVEAAYPVAGSHGPILKWEPGINKKMNLEDMPPMKYLVKMPGPHVFRKRESIEGREIVSHIQMVVGLAETLESALVIPLKAGRGTFGVCTLGELRSWEHSPFSSEKINLANSMASQAAMHIDRMRAHEATERRLTEVDRLRAILQDLVKAVADRPKGILDKVAMNACQVIGADCAIIYPWDRERRSHDISNIAHFGLLQEKPFSDKTRRNNGIMTSIVIRRKMVIVDDASKPRDRTGKIRVWRAADSFMASEGVEAFTGIALHVGEEPLGALFVSFRKPHYFTDDELETIRLFANQAAVAIQQSRLFNQVSEEATQLRLGLLEVGSSISKLRSLHDTLHSAAYGIQHVLDCDVVTVYSYDERNNYLPHPAVVAGELLVPEKMKGYGALLKNQIFQLLMSRDEPHFADDATQDEIMSTGGFVKRERIKSSAGVPLLAGNSRVGLLFVNFRERHLFSESEKEAIRIFANQAAIAILNAIAYKELEDTRDRMLANEAVAWLGLFGADWQHAINQKTFSIRNYSAGLRAWLARYYAPSDLTAEVCEVMDHIEKVADGIRSVQFTSPVPAKTPGEVGGQTSVDRELSAIVDRWCNGRRDVQTILDLKCPGAEVKIQPQWLRVAMEKLINNALKAMPAGGKLTVTTLQVGDTVHITIMDTGKGIPDSARPYFLKSRVPRGPSEEGTGMGVLIARFVALSHGGNLTLVDSRPGRGTELLMTLPLVTDSDARSSTGGKQP